MVSQTFPPLNRTGAPLQALYLTRALGQLGVDVEMLTSCPWKQCTAIAWPDGIRVRAIPFADVRGLRGASRFATSIGVGKRLADWDIIHGHALSPMVLGVALGRGRNGPPMLAKPSIGGDHAEGEITRITRSPAAKILRKAAQRIDRFAILDDLIEADMEPLGIPQERLIRVDNGVDLDRFQPASAEEKARIREQHGLDGRTVVLFCGQLAPRKGLPELLDAWSAMRGDRHNTVLAIAGKGPLLDRVNDEVARSDGDIVYLGQQKDIAPIMRMSDVLALPSRFESFGNVIVEALASGVPVAATRCGISPRAINEGKSGWLIDDTDTTAIKQTLGHVLARRESLADLSAGCREVAEMFSFDRIARRYLEVYDDMLAQRR